MTTADRMGPRVVFRVDASASIGTGHLFRSAVLARALAEAGATVQFVCRELSSDLAALIEGWGFPVRQLPIGVDQTADAVETCRILAQHGPVDWLVVDHYGLDCAWETVVREHATRLMVVDDLADRRHDCELLLDANFYGDPAPRYAGLVPDGCALLLGPKYALLRPEFALARRALAERDTAQRLLICFGGADPTDETTKALAAVAGCMDDRLQVDLVAGLANPRAEELEARCAELPRVTYHRSLPHLVELMAGVDLAIGAGGTMTWERCCLRLPSIVVGIAANQEPGAAALAKAGAHLYLGRSEQVTVEMIRRALTLLRENAGLRRHLQAVAGELVDGRGAERVVRRMLRTPISLRPARADDCERVWEWRNAAEVTQWSLDGRAIPLDVHRHWFSGALADPARHLLIGEVAGEPAGVLRYDVDGEVAEISVFLVPGRLSRGLGAPLLEAGTAWLREQDSRVGEVRARILPQNVASKTVFERAGYVLDHHIYRLSLAGAEARANSGGRGQEG